MARTPIFLEVADDDSPRFSAIARAVVAEIRRGRLRPGDRVPSTRELARDLGVHRNTAVAAYRELVSEGWITSTVGRGSFVAAQIAVPRGSKLAPDRGRVGFSVPPTPPAPVAIRVEGPKPILLDSGLPDPRLLPSDLVARAYRRVLRRAALLTYGDPRGHESLRTALARWLTGTRAIAVDADDILVTHGSQMAIDLVARTLIRPGDAVAVEAFGYRPAWETMRLAGAELVPIPVDSRGLDTAALSRVLGRRRLRLVYVTPHHQYPTTVTLSPARRLALLSLCREHRVALLEDDYDHEFHYESRPIAPLRSMDNAGVVIHVATLSKVLAPGLRIGWVVAPPPLLSAMTRIRQLADRQGDAPLEAAIAELFEDDTVPRHIRRLRKINVERRDAAVAALQRHLGHAVRFDVPSGGMALWLAVDPDVDVDAWVRAAAARGVAIAPGSAFALDGRRCSFVRLGYCRHDPRELAAGIARLASALPRRPVRG